MISDGIGRVRLSPAIVEPDVCEILDSGSGLGMIVSP